MGVGVDVFFSYAHKDEKYRIEVEKQLINLKRQGLITSWHDRDINAGTDWEHEISRHLDSAQIILLLISPDFLASEYCYSIEMQQAVRRHETGQARVIPIVLRPVAWEHAPFKKLQVLPKNAKPVKNWSNRDEAYLDIARGIHRAVVEITTQPDPTITTNTIQERPNRQSYQSYPLQNEHIHTEIGHQQSQDVLERPLRTKTRRSKTPRSSSELEIDAEQATFRAIDTTTRTGEKNGIEFIAQRSQHYANSIDVTIQDGSDVVFRREVLKDEDNIGGWYAHLFALQYRNRKQLEALFDLIPKLLSEHVFESDLLKEARLTYFNMLHGIFKFLELQKAAGEISSPNNQLCSQLEQFLFHFRTTQQFQHYEMIFAFGEGRSEQESYRQIIIRIPIDNFEQSPVEICQTKLASLKPEYVQYLIENYVHFQASLPSSDSVTNEMFICLSKALISVIKQRTDILGAFASYIPSIAQFILKNQLDDIEEQEVYLKLLLNNDENEWRKLERLYKTIEDIKNRIAQRQSTMQPHSKQRKEDDHRQLMHVVSLISDHYLRLYDLDSSANFWQKVKSSDPILWFLLTLHRWPLFYFLCEIAVLSIPFIFAYLHWLTGQPCPLLLGSPDPIIVRSCAPPLASPALEFIAVLPWYVLLSLLIFVICIQILRRRWLYSQLLLPRLLGAAIVGLLPLLLSDQAWNIGTQSNPFNWSLLATLTYTGSFIYIFIEVHRKKRFVRGYSIVQALRESRRIFLIALSETLFIATVASSIFFPTVLSSGSDITRYRFGIYASTPLLSVGFFPFLIILWTGIALFIGSFVQLIWQDRQNS